MLALRMRQKNSEFYFVSYPAADLLKHVRFETRFYGDRGEVVGGDTPGADGRATEPDDVERFVRAIERSAGAFQRELNRRKVRQIRDPFLIIDGQHRLAGLHFYLGEPDADRRIEVPCVIFDGKTAEFATEMFVIMINQAQLFGEVHRFVARRDAEPWITDGRGLSRDRAYGFLRDVLRAAKRTFGDAWGDNKRYMVTRDVTLKALVRVAGDAAARSRAFGVSPAASSEVESVLVKKFAGWSSLVGEFRRDGFYERFPARGQVERVEKLRARLSREAGL